MKFNLLFVLSVLFFILINAAFVYGVVYPNAQNESLSVVRDFESINNQFIYSKDGIVEQNIIRNANGIAASSSSDFNGYIVEFEKEPLEEKFEILTNMSPDCIKLFNLENKIEFMNPGGLKEHGFKSLEEARGFDWTKSVIPEQREEILKKIKYTFLDKKINLLEIGPGKGNFAEFCVKNNINYFGIEQSKLIGKELIQKGFNIKIFSIPNRSRNL